MTATLPEQPDVIVADKDDLREAVRRILERAGISFAELAEQGRTGDFKDLSG